MSAEVLLMIGVIVVLERLIPGPASLAALSPHPLWLPVIVAAMTHGTVGGLFAAAVATMASLWIDQSAQMATEDALSYALRTFIDPVLWVGSALLIGELHNVRQRHADQLARDLLEANVQRTRVGELCRKLEAHVIDLERYRATALARSVGAALDQLGRLTRSNTTHDAAAALAASVDLLLDETVEYRVLLLHNRQLLEERSFMRGGDGQRNAIPMGTRFFDQIVQRRQALSMLRDEDNAALAGVGLFATPIVAPGGTTVVGALVVTFADAEQIGPSLETGMRIIAQELAGALEGHGASGLNNNEHERAAA